MRIYYPQPLREGGKFTNRLSRRNYAVAALIRKHNELGLIRVYVIGDRYWDRGVGGFMSGGGWVYRGTVICEPCPVRVEDQAKLPDKRSGAGSVSAESSEKNDGGFITLGATPPTKSVAKYLGGKFWDIDEAIAYANGEDDGAIAKVTSPVRVTWSKLGYRICEL